jgi:hypothetical protein
VEIKPQPITPEYSAPTYTPCGPWITSYDRNNPWQIIWNSISFAPDPYQQMFNFQANRYGPGLQRRTYKFDPEKTYNITLIQSNEYAYFTYGGFYDHTTGSWIPIQYVGTELTGVIGSDLGATSIYDYTQDYPNGLYHNESKYQLRMKRDVPSGEEIIMSVYDGQETINYHTRVEVPTFTIGSITDEDTLLHYYSREIEFILNFQQSCQIDGYGGAYPTGIKFNVEIVQGQEYGNLYYPGTVADPEQSGASITNIDDEYGIGIANYTIKYKADGVQPDELNPGIVTIRCSANDMDIAPVEISFPVKYNTDPPDEGGSIVVEFDKENYKPGETAVANCKWLTGYDELIDFPIDQRFSVEITGGSEYGILQDPSTGTVSNVLEDISNGFRVLTATEIAEEEARIILKVRTTVGGGIPTRALKQNDLEAEERNNRGENNTITPELLVIGGEEIIGYGTVIVKKDECYEEIVVCNNFEPQTLSQSAFEVVRSNTDWHWVDENGTAKSTNIGDGCIYMPPNNPNELEFGKVYFMENIGTDYEALDDMIVEACLDESDPENKKWRFNLSNIRIPIMNTLCLTEPKNRNWIDLGDGTNTTLLENYIADCLSFGNVMRALRWHIEGGYLQQARGIPLEFAVYSSIAVQVHEDEHVRQLKRLITEKMNEEHFPQIRTLFTLLQSGYHCPEDAVIQNKNTFKTLLKSYFNDYNNLEYWLRPDEESGVPNSELEADRAAYQTYVDIYNAIYDWVVPPDPQRLWYNPLEPGCLGIRRIEEGE